MNSECTCMTQNASLSRVPLKTSHWAVELVEKHHTTSLRMTQNNMLQYLMLPLIFPKKHRPYGCLHLSPGICFRFPGLFLSHLRRHGSGLFSDVDDDRRDESKTTAGPGRNGWARTPKTTLTFNVPKGATKLEKKHWHEMGHVGWVHTLWWYMTWEGVGLIQRFLTLGHLYLHQQTPGFWLRCWQIDITYFKKSIHYDSNHFLRDQHPQTKNVPSFNQNIIILPLLTSIDVVSLRQWCLRTNSAWNFLGISCWLSPVTRVPFVNKWSYLTGHFWKVSIGQLMETYMHITYHNIQRNI